MNDRLADFGGPGERYLVDIRMFGQRGAGRMAVAGHQIDDAIGQSRLGKDVHDLHRCQRRLFRWLDDYAAASSERRRQLHAGHQDRTVPWQDQASNRIGLLQGIGMELGARLPQIAIGHQIIGHAIQFG